MVRTEPLDRLFTQGWWLATHDEPSAGIATAGASRYTVWLLRIDGNGLQLHSSEAPVAGPAWAPDGQRVAYARLTQSAAGDPTIELSVHEGRERSRVLWAQSLPRLIDASELGDLAWSPKGGLIAVPQVEGTALVRSDNGRLERALPNCRLPAWSSDESWLAVWQGGAAEGYYVSRFGDSKLTRAVPVRDPRQPALWDTAGDGFLCLAGPATNVRGVDSPRPLVRYECRTGAKRALPTLAALGDVMRQSDVQMARRPGTDRLVLAAGASGEVWELQEAGRSPPRRLPIVPRDLQWGWPTCAPDGGWCLLRAAGPFGPLVLYEFRTDRIVPLIPDADSLLAIERLVVARCLAFRGPSRGEAGGKPSGRHSVQSFTCFPTPGDRAAFELRDARIADRFEQVAQFGLDCLDRARSVQPTVEQSRRLREVELYLLYVRGRYSAARRLAEAHRPMALSRRERLGLEFVRALCFVGERNWGEAREVLHRLAATTEAGAPDSHLQAALQRLADEIRSGERDSPDGQ